MNLMLTPEIEEKLRNPKPGSKIEAAIKCGLNVETLIENLKLTPQQRIDRLQIAVNILKEGENKERKRNGLHTAIERGEPLAEFTITFKQGVDFVKATDALNNLADDFYVYENPWYNVENLRLAHATKPALERIFGWVIIRKVSHYGFYFWETEVETNKFPEGLEGAIENMGLCQPGSGDEGQWYEWE